jgi:hypothetical protein
MKRPGALGVKLYSARRQRAVGSNLAAVTREKQFAILVAIRRRLTAQGNGQATLDHEGTRERWRRGDSPGNEAPRQIKPGSAA